MTSVMNSNSAAFTASHCLSAWMPTAGDGPILAHAFPYIGSVLEPSCSHPPQPVVGLMLSVARLGGALVDLAGGRGAGGGVRNATERNLTKEPASQPHSELSTTHYVEWKTHGEEEVEHEEEDHDGARHHVSHEKRVFLVLVGQIRVEQERELPQACLSHTNKHLKKTPQDHLCTIIDLTIHVNALEKTTSRKDTPLAVVDQTCVLSVAFRSMNSSRSGPATAELRYLWLRRVKSSGEKQRPMPTQEGTRGASGGDTEDPCGSEGEKGVDEHEEEEEMVQVQEGGQHSVDQNPCEE
eukprot:406891-Rhodomonas_salina.1